MSNQHIRAWQDLLQRLSDLKDNFHDSEWLPYRQLARAALMCVDGLPAMPRAALKKFVQEAQIPRRLVAAAVALPADIPADIPADRAVFLRIFYADALQHLLHCVTAAGLRGSYSSSSLSTTFAQQLFQEGLFRFFTACMTNAAEQLQAAASMRRASLLHPADFSAHMHISQQDFSALGANYAALLLQLYSPLHTQLTTAQQVQESLKNFAAMATPAACHLTVASLQYIAAIQHPGRQQQQQQQGSAAAGEPDGILAFLLQSCCLCMPTVLETASSTWNPELMQSFYLIPWMAASWLVQSYASLMQQHTLLPAAQSHWSSNSSSSSSIGKSSRAKPRTAAAGTSSSSTSSSGSRNNPVSEGPGTGVSKDEALRTWREAARQLDRLPAAHSELAALLGTDLQTIVWAASTSVKVVPSRKVLPTFLKVCPTFILQPVHSSLLGLHELLPVLLYWAAHQPGGVYDSQVHQAMEGCFIAVICWLNEHQPSSIEQQQDDAAAAVGAAPQYLEDLPSLHPCMIEEGLPLVLLLLARLQQQQPAIVSSAGGATAAATDMHGMQQSSTAAHVTKPLPPTVATQMPGVELLCWMCACSPDGATATACAAAVAGAPAEAEATAAAGASAPRAHVDIAQQHVTSVFKLLEPFVRANVRENVTTSDTLYRLSALFSSTQARSSLRCLSALATASGDEAQHRLLGLLRSLLKLSAIGHQRDCRTALACAGACSTAASKLINCLAAGSAAADSAAGSHCCSSSSSSSSSKLPWLHLLGHCFMQWGAERQRIGVEADGPEEEEVDALPDHSPVGAGVSAAAAAATAVCVSTQSGLSSALQQQQHREDEPLHSEEQQQMAEATSQEGPPPAPGNAQMWAPPLAGR